MNHQGEDHDHQEYEYDSLSSAPATPKNGEPSGEKKKKSRGLKKLFTKKKSGIGSGIVEDEGVGSESRRRSFSSFLKIGSRTPKRDDAKTPETSSEKNVTHNRDEAPKEETKHKPTLAEKLGEGAHHLMEKAMGDTKKQSHSQPTETKLDDKGKAKAHQEPEVKHDHHHHEQKEHPHDDVKEEKMVATETRAVTEEGQGLVSPLLHDKESNGCATLAKGLQQVCLPWTVKNEDH